MKPPSIRLLLTEKGGPIQAFMSDEVFKSEHHVGYYSDRDLRAKFEKLRLDPQFTHPALGRGVCWRVVHDDVSPSAFDGYGAFASFWSECHLPSSVASRLDPADIDSPRGGPPAPPSRRYSGAGSGSQLSARALHQHKREIYRRRSLPSAGPPCWQPSPRLPPCSHQLPDHAPYQIPLSEASANHEEDRRRPTL